MSKNESFNYIFENADFSRIIGEITEAVSEDSNRINGMLKIEFIEYDKINKKVIYEVPVIDWELNPNDNLHGGISATIMDTTLGIFANGLCRELGGYFCPTVSMNINYLLPIPAKERLVVEVKVVSSGKSLLILNGEARVKGSENLAVTASASFKVMKNRD